MQNGFAEPASDARSRASALADRLSNRFGSAAVTVLGPRGSHIPERARSQAGTASFGSEKLLTPRLCAAVALCGPPRPAFILARPEPIDVIADVPDGPPASFIWRRVERRVARAEGPERISPEWWRTLYLADDQKRPRPRDYYRIEDGEEEPIGCSGTGSMVGRRKARRHPGSCMGSLREKGDAASCLTEER